MNNTIDSLLTSEIKSDLGDLPIEIVGVHYQKGDPNSMNNPFNSVVVRYRFSDLESDCFTRWITVTGDLSLIIAGFNWRKGTCKIIADQLKEDYQKWLAGNLIYEKASDER